MAGTPWSDAENARIVEDYFAMLRDDLAGRPYSKAAHNRRLQRQIRRGRGAIEYKHQNISAVLKGLGESWIPGYRPAFNFQMSLARAVARRLARHPGDLAPAPAGKPAPGLEAATPLSIEPPPSLRNEPPPDELPQMLELARTFDVAGRAERNRVLGRAGEVRALAHERATLVGAGRRDLAGRVRWVSEEDGDGAGYDIASYAPDGRVRLVEVKTTNGWERTPFYLTRNERAVAEESPAEWRLLRLWNFARAPRAFELRPPLDRHVMLIATGFEARFR